MRIFVPEGIASSLTGRAASKDEFKLLAKAVPVPSRINWLIDLMSTYALAGCRVSLPAEADMSGYGVEMIWLTPAQMVSELQDAEPGITAGKSGFIPMGMCAKGSGDPYFFDLRAPNTDDPPVVRLLHDMAGDDIFPDEGIETVQPSLSSFFAKLACYQSG